MTDNSINMLVVTPAGEVRDHTLPASEDVWANARATLEALYKQIGCSAVDVVRLAPDVDMWVDDEGALQPRMRVNPLASYIATRFGYPFQLYVGTAVFTGGADRDGNSRSLGQPAREMLLGLIAELRSIRWGR